MQNTENDIDEVICNSNNIVVMNNKTCISKFL